MPGIAPSHPTKDQERQLERRLREKYAAQLADEAQRAPYEARIETELADARFADAFNAPDHDFLIR